ncbi:FmdB family transcriptional regulator [Aeromicrobium sp. Marseille-Q0843]|uniref:FmdB family transcriptional regulator n=1 Tax=Aeromicrobium phoceense TaxID=2754045 RepID=A0A838X6B1_9ACTN|nr:FmdB family transcriptional regulator [Aeromicrobium phoceense]
MPTYQYRCADCAEELEIKQSFSDAALTTCPSCGGDLRKVFGAAGVVFKGSGFYRTDSRSGGGSSSGSSSSSSSSSSGSSSSSSSSGSTGSGAA